MNVLNSSFIALLVSFLPIVSSAATVIPDGTFILSPSPERFSISVKANSSDKSSGVKPAIASPSAMYIPNLGEVTHNQIKFICVCSNSLSGTINHSGLLVNNDHINSSIYVPMQGINNALSLVETAIQSKLADSLITFVQALTMVAKRQVNTELTYSVNINNYSRVDSGIIYRLHPIMDSGNSEILASLRYSSKF